MRRIHILGVTMALGLAQSLTAGCGAGGEPTVTGRGGTMVVAPVTVESADPVTAACDALRAVLPSSGPRAYLDAGTALPSPADSAVAGAALVAAATAESAGEGSRIGTYGAFLDAVEACLVAGK
jgi:hypothetical protein